jgi:hypothetical protein
MASERVEGKIMFFLGNQKISLLVGPFLVEKRVCPLYGAAELGLGFVSTCVCP